MLRVMLQRVPKQLNIYCMQYCMQCLTVCPGLSSLVRVKTKGYRSKRQLSLRRSITRSFFLSWLPGRLTVHTPTQSTWFSLQLVSLFVDYWLCVTPKAPHTTLTTPIFEPKSIQLSRVNPRQSCVSSACHDAGDVSGNVRQLMPDWPKLIPSQ